MSTANQFFVLLPGVPQIRRLRVIAKKSRFTRPFKHDSLVVHMGLIPIKFCDLSAQAEIILDRDRLRSRWHAFEHDVKLHKFRIMMAIST